MLYNETSLQKCSHREYKDSLHANYIDQYCDNQLIRYDC